MAASKVAALLSSPKLPSLGSLTPKNRVVMAPMTRCRCDPHSGVLSDLSVQYYRQRANAGLIVSEAVAISTMGIGYARVPGIFTLPHVLAWRKVTQAVKEKDSAIFAQLWHCGRIANTLNRYDDSPPVAPSAIPAKGKMWTDQAGLQEFSVPVALTTEGVHHTIDDFAKATETALSAGFSGVELHAASGYLPHQFLSSNANKRTDAYGGSVINRCRFVLETLEEMIQAAGGASHKVGVKLSPKMGFNDCDEEDPEEVYTTLLKLLKPLNLAYVHVLRSSQMDVVGLFRKVYGSTLVVGGGYTAESGVEALQKDQADLIAYGTPFISNPDLVERFSRGAALAQADPNTFYSIGPKGYIDYPMLPN